MSGVHAIGSVSLSPLSLRTHMQNTRDIHTYIRKLIRQEPTRELPGTTTGPMPYNSHGKKIRYVVANLYN